MPDDSLLWTHKPAPRCRPRPGEPLWSVRQEHMTWSAELHFPGEGYGWEAQILRDGELTIGRRFLLKAEALKWAEAEKALADDRLEWMS
jgi:hypothetical protein